MYGIKDTCGLDCCKPLSMLRLIIIYASEYYFHSIIFIEKRCFFLLLLDKLKILTLCMLNTCTVYFMLIF